jgi:hypothetical protein
MSALMILHNTVLILKIISIAERFAYFLDSEHVECCVEVRYAEQVLNRLFFCGGPYLDLEVFNQPSTSPSIQVVALVPVDTKTSEFVTKHVFMATGTYKVFRPAMRGCVAHEPPKIMLCFPSKKSAGSCQHIIKYSRELTMLPV